MCARPTPPATEAPPAGSATAANEFEAFFRAHERDLFGYLWRLTSEEQVARDLCQEAFFRAWQRFAIISQYDKPAAWLFRVATNLALNHRRHARVTGPSAPLDDDSGPRADDPAAHLAERDAVQQTLLALPPRQRAALVLREVYGFSCEEVAAALGISLGAAKMTLSRGRAQFRERYLRGEVRQ